MTSAKKACVFTSFCGQKMDNGGGGDLWEELPDELVLEVRKWLRTSVRDLVAWASTCSRFLHLTNEPALWAGLFSLAMAKARSWLPPDCLKVLEEEENDQASSGGNTGAVSVFGQVAISTESSLEALPLAGA
jgi:hypothetical protein